MRSFQSWCRQEHWSARNFILKITGEERYLYRHGELDDIIEPQTYCPDLSQANAHARLFHDLPFTRRLLEIYHP